MTTNKEMKHKQVTLMQTSIEMCQRTGSNYHRIKFKIFFSRSDHEIIYIVIYLNASWCPGCSAEAFIVFSLNLIHSHSLIFEKFFFFISKLQIIKLQIFCIKFTYFTFLIVNCWYIFVLLLSNELGDIYSWISQSKRLL